MQDTAHRSIKANLALQTAVAAVALLALDAYVASAKAGIVPAFVAVASKLVDTTNLVGTAAALLSLFSASTSVARASAALAEKNAGANRAVHVAAAVFLTTKNA